MIRRFAPIVLILLLLTACSGAERDSLIAGDDSLSRAELQNLLIALSGGETGEVELTTVPASDLRIVGTVVLRGIAVVDYFETEGGGIPDEVWARQQDNITDVSTPLVVPFSQVPLNLGFLEFESPEFDALLTLLVADEMAISQGADLDVQEILTEYTEGFEVESRIGTWDDQTFSIVAP